MKYTQVTVVGTIYHRRTLRICPSWVKPSRFPLSLSLILSYLRAARRPAWTKYTDIVLFYKERHFLHIQFHLITIKGSLFRPVKGGIGAWQLSHSGVWREVCKAGTIPPWYNQVLLMWISTQQVLDYTRRGIVTANPLNYDNTCSAFFRVTK